MLYIIIQPSKELWSQKIDILQKEDYNWINYYINRKEIFEAECKMGISPTNSLLYLAINYLWVSQNSLRPCSMHRSWVYRENLIPF